VKKRQIGEICVVCIKEELLNTEAQIYKENKNNLKINVNFVITRLVNIEQKECVPNIIKI
jgi:hypothetical protein